MNVLKYLEAFKVEEVALEYQEIDYQAVVSPFEMRPAFEIKSHCYDLVATNCHRKVALVSVARSDLADHWVDELIEQAEQEGFTFTLGFFNRPRESQMEVEELDQTICKSMGHELPVRLAELPVEVQVGSVDYLGMERVSVRGDKISVAGTGVVDVALRNGHQPPVEWRVDFPFAFEVELDHELQLKRVHHMTVDTSSFYAEASEAGEGVER